MYVAKPNEGKIEAPGLFTVSLQEYGGEAPITIIIPVPAPNKNHVQIVTMRGRGQGERAI